MILLENKLQMFNKIVYVTKERECLEKLDNEKKRIEQEIENKKVELQRNSEDTINRRVGLANKRKYEILGKVFEDKRISELQKNEELRGKLIEELEKKVVEFTKTDDYVNFYKDKFKTLLKELDAGDYILRTMASDKTRLYDAFKEMTEGTGINLIYEELDPKLLGGFTISDKEETYNIDSSFKEKIEDRKYEIGKLLDFTLKKAGEQD